MKLTPRGGEDEKVTLRSWSVSIGASPWTRVTLTKTDVWWDNYIWNTTRALGLFWHRWSNLLRNTSRRQTVQSHWAHLKFDPRSKLYKLIVKWKIRFHFFCRWTLAPTLAPRGPKLYKKIHRVILCTFWGCSNQDFWGLITILISWQANQPIRIRKFRQWSVVLHVSVSNLICICWWHNSNSTNVILLLTSVVYISKSGPDNTDMRRGSKQMTNNM